MSIDVNLVDIKIQEFTIKSIIPRKAKFRLIIELDTTII
jgi:hypothetical protein